MRRAGAAQGGQNIKLATLQAVLGEEGAHTLFAHPLRRLVKPPEQRHGQGIEVGPLPPPLPICACGTVVTGHDGVDIHRTNIYLTIKFLIVCYLVVLLLDDTALELSDN